MTYFAKLLAHEAAGNAIRNEDEQSALHPQPPGHPQQGSMQKRLYSDVDR
jgi:hypothetical protein